MDTPAVRHRRHWYDPTAIAPGLLAAIAAFLSLLAALLGLTGASVALESSICAK